MDDQQALERYRYMLRTAPPEDIERAHAEAFAQLSPDQRRMVLEQLASQVPPSEVPRSDDPQSLARLATRAEMRQPGTMERTFSQVPAGPGLGSMFLMTLAGAFVGTAIAGAFFGDGVSEANAADTGSDYGTEGDTQGDSSGGDWGDQGADYGAGDTGGGDYGGDFGGGDFGAGDFGGGDFGGF
jgi:hypothetical protein